VSLGSFAPTSVAMVLASASGCQRGRLRWAEPPKWTGPTRGVPSGSELDSEDSVLSLAVSSDTAGAWPGTARLRNACDIGTESLLGARPPRGGRDALTELQARCESLESESLVLRKELRRMQKDRSCPRDGSPSTSDVSVRPPQNITAHSSATTERRRLGGLAPARKAHAPLLPICAICGSRPSVPSRVSGACRCGLDAQVAELRTELGEMAMKAVQDREAQASQISKLEQELKAAEQRAQEIRDLELADEAAAEFERVAARRREVVKELIEAAETSEPASAAAGSQSSLPRAPNRTSHTGSAPGLRSAGRLPPTQSFRGLSAPAEHSIPRVVPLFDSPDGFASALSAKPIRPMTTPAPSLLMTAWDPATLCGSSASIDNLNFGKAAPAVPVASGPAPIATGSSAIGSEAAEAGQGPSAATAAAPAASAGPLPAVEQKGDPGSPVGTSENSDTVPPAQPAPPCQAAQFSVATPRETPPFIEVTSTMGKAKAVAMANGSGLTDLDETVAMKLYHRFGLNTCISFEKFVQLHQNHLPSEEACMRPTRPSSGGA